MSRGRLRDARARIASLARSSTAGRSPANAESVWFWESPAGRRRADRRAELFVEHGGLAPGRRALELGCGTGVFLERVARCGASLHGLDLSEDLLEKARARVAGLANVVLDRGNAEATPYPDASLRRRLRLVDPAPPESRRRTRRGPPRAAPGRTRGVRRAEHPEPAGAADVPLRPAEAALRGLAGRDGLLPVPSAPRARARRLRGRRRSSRSTSCIPAIPAGWVERGLAASRVLERVPLVREFAGSMLMRARRA